MCACICVCVCVCVCCDVYTLSSLQYTMLCGRAPFFAQSLSTEEIMERIQSGQFSLVGPEWEGVSPPARNLIEGLLTVDAQSRLTLGRVLAHPWLTPASAPATPLLTSCVLGREKGTASAIKHTFHAFHQVYTYTVVQYPLVFSLSLSPGDQGWVYSRRCSQSSAGQEEEEKERSLTSPTPHTLTPSLISQQQSPQHPRTRVIISFPP